MGRITLQQAAQWVGGQIDPKYKDVTFCGAEYDSRNLKPGELFVAIKAARDGHDFIPAALSKGAAAVLCSHCDGDYPAIVVEDTRLALGKLAEMELKRLGVKVVAVTGSVGKSTTKEMIVSVLETAYRVAKTPANRNNDLGMPAAILSMPEEAQIAVLEMGMSHFGEIEYLSRIGCPDLAVIINIGTMHIENLGSQEGILQAKLEILAGLKADGKLLLNGDDALLRTVREKGQLQPVYFGTAADCQVRAENVMETAEGIHYDVVSGNDRFGAYLALEGQHYVIDSLAAVAVGKALNISDENIQKGLAAFHTMAGRQEIFAVNGRTIISDCYNAGPESMAAALAVLGNRPGRHIAVLGDMLELGDHAPKAHEAVGAIAAQKAHVILAYGPDGEYVQKGATEAGMAEANALWFTDRDALAQYLKQISQPEDVLLFKGSRGMRMELILEKFLQQEN